MLRAMGHDPDDPAGALRAVAESDPRLLVLLEPMLGVTLTPTMAHASEKVNVIPSHAYIKVDCRVPPGLGEEVARERIGEVLGSEADNVQIEFDDRVTGNTSAAESRLMEAIAGWVAANDRGAEAVPVILPGFSDSRWFREAFPDCTAYGFFPQRYMELLDREPLVHSADERIDVRDLGFAARFYTDVARELLG
jgi:acetylornithine deacetylase/succinyl-diaminopimelate desuccinylase-like protein